MLFHCSSLPHHTHSISVTPTTKVMPFGVIVCPICLDKLEEAEPKGGDLPSTSSHGHSSSRPECHHSQFLRQSHQSQLTESAEGVRKQIQVIPCGHIFHSTCLKDWTSEGKSDCPTCRRIFNPAKILTIYPQFLNSSSGQVLTDLPQNVQHHLKKSINSCLEGIQTTICRLEDKLGSITSSSSVLPQQAQCQISAKIGFVPLPCITAPDRIAEMLRHKIRQKSAESSLEKEIVELKGAIEAVNKTMNDYGKKVGHLTESSSRKDKKIQKELMDSLARINRLVLEDQALKHSLNKRVCQLKPKTSATLLNDECNRLCSVLNHVSCQNHRMHADIQMLLEDFSEIKKLVGKILENLLCL